MQHHRRFGRAARAICLVLFLLLAMLVTVAPAAGAPAEETLGLDELRARLESGPLDGHMKTAMSGYAVEEIPVTVHALVEDAWGSLILFEATGPEIDRIGGIALGMSGSPVYVDAGAGPKLVGAVSYGDQFTLGGMGLATPIEYMADLQATYAQEPAAVVGTYDLAEPVATDQGRLSSVVIARSVGAAESLEAAAEQTIMAPLALVEIGGLRPQSRAYQALAARLERNGLTVRPAAGGGVWDGPPAPPLEAGSPCVAMFSRGTVWFGAAGTVTYVDGDTALLFGHPLWWAGPTEAALHAGYVSGVWPSLLAPYKLVAPRDEKGAVVQDRYWGVVARLDRTADMVPVTTHAVYPTEGIEVTDRSSVSQWLFTQPYYFQAVPYVTLYALTAANDIEYYAGSAETTTRVVVSDRTGTYVLERDNLWDTGDDVAMQATTDVNSMLAPLADDADGVLRPHVESIELDAAVSPERRSARIAGLVLPKGLVVGDNAVVVQYYAYGSRELRTVEGTLTLPKGVARSGTLVVTPSSRGMWDDYDDYEPDTSPPRTLAELVDEINATPPNSDLTVVFEPDYSMEQPITVEARLATPCVFGNEFRGETARVRVEADRTTVPFGGGVVVSGAVSAVDGEIKLDVLRLDAGRTGETYVKTITARGDGGAARFATKVGDLRRNTRIIVRTRPTSQYLTANGAVSVKVRAAVSLGAERLSTGARLTVKVRPVAATGTVLLEKLRDGRWVVIRSAPRASAQTITFRVGSGTHVLRARFVNGDICANGVSTVLTVRAD
ncbi:MAG TPA: hypothetical protein VLA35_08770 [Thermoleophilia bacterium]|nr:hypothetical protein [Thermoleophilia bacterium]